MKSCILSNECLSHGYPRRNINGEYVYLNRYILEQKLGRPVKDGYEACHNCNITNCIEPEHLYEGTHWDNMQDLISKGNTRFFGNYNKEITHCPKGHEYNEENTRINKQGNRSCRTCARELSKITNNRRKLFWKERNQAVSI